MTGMIMVDLLKRSLMGFPRRPSRLSPMGLAAVVLAILAGGQAAAAATLAEATALFNTGKYQEALAASDAAIAQFERDEGWYLLKIRSEMTLGRYADALRSYEASLRRNEESIRLRLAGYDVFRANNKPREAMEVLITIRQLAVRDPWRYASGLDRLALGRALLLAGADARQVLELFYDSAKKQSPELAEPFMASGQLALEKEDYAVAAESFEQAAKLAPDNPDIYRGLAEAYNNDSERASAALVKALELNPRHVDSLLFQAGNLIDQEAYEQSEALLAQVIEINRRHPQAWAYRAVMAHLKGDQKAEAAHRKEALSSWTTNPEVDTLIGQKLAQKYRFKEGAAYQRQALKLDPTHRPAKIELCQALLRLGQEDEGWLLAAEIFKEDPYNVLAFNLSTLHDHLKKFTTLSNDYFTVRMEEREAKIYGQAVLDLLEEARVELCRKYDVQLTGKIIVEVFPQQKDFAIRTFGMPGGDGYLGVCFGPVITVNSPASRGANPTNWQAIIWHEFCHAVTLHKTNNKMPRWLSEGISVYEERTRNAGWGQTMNPEYREIVLKGPVTPMSKLSGAFLKPKTAMDLQFAYYESSMAVEYLIEQYGMPVVQKVLADLGRDVQINDALAKYTKPIEALDAEFDAWLKRKAEALAPKAELARPEGLPLDADSAAMAAWNKEHPNNFWGLLGEARALLAEKKFEQAREPLLQAIDLYPNYGGPGGPYLLLASVHKELGDTKAEAEALQKHVAINGDSIEPRMRLAELAAAEKRWDQVKNFSQQVLAVNPLIPAPHRYLAESAEALKDRPLAIGAHRTLLLMNPLDRAGHHYRLARLLADEQRLPEAKREVLLALETAPRYIDAHKLLLEIAKVEPAGRPAVSPLPNPTLPPATTAPAANP